jgi:hypothetical protein
MPNSLYQVTISNFTGSTPCTSYDIYTGVTHVVDNATFVETVSSSTISGHTVNLSVDSSYTHVYLFIEHCDGHINSVPTSTPKLQGGYQVTLVDLRCNDCVGSGPVISTQTPTPTQTLTSTPTNTPTQTSTSTPTQTQTSTLGVTPTSTSTPTQTPTLTATSTSTQTPTQTSTMGLTPTSTPTSTETPTQTPTQTLTSTPTQTLTSTNTPTQTSTNTPTLTSTPTPTPTTLCCYQYEITNYYNIPYDVYYVDCNGDSQTISAAGNGQQTYITCALEGSLGSEAIYCDMGNTVDCIVWVAANEPCGGCVTPTQTPTSTTTSTPTSTPTNTPTLTATSTSTNTPTQTPTSTSTEPVTQTPTPTPTTSPCGSCFEYYNNNSESYSGINYTDCSGVEQINVTVGPGQGICVIPGTISGNYGFLIITIECGYYACLPTPTPTLTATATEPAPPSLCYTADNTTGQEDCEIEYIDCATNNPTIYNVTAGSAYSFCSHTIISDVCSITQAGSDPCVDCQCPQGPPPTECYCLSTTFSEDDYGNVSDDGILYVQYVDCLGTTQNIQFAIYGTVTGPCAQSVISYHILVNGNPSVPATSTVTLSLSPCTANEDCA